MKFIDRSIYWHGTGRIFNYLNRLLHDILGCAPAVILIIFVCEVKIIPLFEELTQIIIPYFIIE
jgi:hypothetical protein